MKSLFKIFTAACISLGTLSSQAQIATTAEEVSPLLIGESIPVYTLKTPDNKAVSTKDIFTEPTVLIIYRGGWCPYCTTHLSAVGQMADSITALGYKVVAISPDAPEKLVQTGEKQELNYTLYSDASGEFIQAMGLAFYAPDRYGKMLDKASGDMNKNHVIPVPSLYVVKPGGTIQFEYISPNYKERISAELLINVLTALQ